MSESVYVGIELRSEIPTVRVTRVFSNESTAEIWAEQSQLREYEEHVLESRLGTR